MPYPDEEMANCSTTTSPLTIMKQHLLVGRIAKATFLRISARETASSAALDRTATEIGCSIVVVATGCAFVGAAIATGSVRPASSYAGDAVRGCAIAIGTCPVSVTCVDNRHDVYGHQSDFALSFDHLAGDNLCLVGHNEP